MEKVMGFCSGRIISPYEERPAGAVLTGEAVSKGFSDLGLFPEQT
jgi:hypothetical protein